MFPELKALPYEERLRRLSLWSLEERRNRPDLYSKLELFEMIKAFSRVSWSQFFECYSTRLLVELSSFVHQEALLQMDQVLGRGYM